MVTNISEQTSLYPVQSDPYKPANVTPGENEQLMDSLFYMSIYALPCHANHKE
jgi:hypothetical protein